MGVIRTELWTGRSSIFVQMRTLDVRMLDDRTCQSNVNIDLYAAYKVNWLHRGHQQIMDRAHSWIRDKGPHTLRSNRDGARSNRVTLTFNLRNSGSMHAEILPWSMCVPSLVLIAQVVILLELRHADIHTY